MGRLFLGDGSMSIVVDNLTVSYRRRPAVHHLDTEFSDGCMCAVFGPNGAGKSTLLKALMGLLKADTGNVRHVGLKRSDIAYLPQQSDVDRSQPITVFELAALGLWYEIGFFGRVNAKQRERVMQALERVGMAETANHQIAHLSNGQFQRVLFARMLAQDAKFLLLDEPFNAIDAGTTHVLLEVLHGCHQTGQSVIAVLHDYDQVRTYFPETLLIARKKIAEGATESVLTEENMQQANAVMQQHELEAWCKD
ncbi:metal ABC transporter ATP-binding protein [Neisseria zalophi]|uniref:Metal ABC transporter ATP-binding protein n=2 Tax=Neisseria zalophi TaxID=640030 RepID=A0A5J6PZ76_9NEIS|nr:metal ABC transporter ATP-binding protein [Neisseria zalophi]